MKFAATVFEYARGFGQVGAELLNILVRRRTCLPEALVLGLHFRQSIFVFESLAGQARGEVFLSLESLRAKSVGLFAEPALGVERG